MSLGFEPEWLVVEQEHIKWESKDNRQLLDEAKMGKSLEYVMPLLSKRISIDDLISQCTGNTALAHAVVSYTPLFKRMQPNNISRLSAMHPSFLENREFIKSCANEMSIAQLLHLGFKCSKWMSSIVEYFILNLKEINRDLLTQEINVFFLEKEEYAAGILSQIFLADKLTSSSLTQRARIDKNFADKMLNELNDHFDKLTLANLFEIAFNNINYAFYILEFFSPSVLIAHEDRILLLCEKYKQCASTALELLAENISGETAAKLTQLSSMEIDELTPPSKRIKA